MPLYYFDVHDGSVFNDKVGKNLPDLDAAREEARRLSFAMASEIALKRDAVQLRVNVRNSFGARVFTGTLLFLIEAPSG